MFVVVLKLLNQKMVVIIYLDNYCKVLISINNLLLNQLKMVKLISIKYLKPKIYLMREYQQS